MMNRTLQWVLAVSILAGTIAVGGTQTIAGEADSKTIADILPEGTIMFAEIAPWSRWSMDFSKTSVSKICSEAEVQQFLAGPFIQITNLIKSATEKKNDQTLEQDKEKNAPGGFATFMEVIRNFAPGPLAVAVRYSPEDAQAGRVPAVAVILGVSPDKNIEAFSNLIPNILENFLHNWKIESIRVIDYQNSKLLSINTMGGGERQNLLTMTLYKGQLIIGNEVQFCEQIMDGLAGNLPKKLSATQTYKNSGLTGDEHLIAYLDLAGLQASLGAADKPAPDAPNQLDDFFVLAGLNKTVAVAWSLKMNGPAFESRTAIFSKGEREGLLGTLDEEPLSEEALKICPATTPFAAGFRLRSDRVVPFLRNSIKTVQGQKGLENFNAMQKQLNTEFDRDLEKEIREAFGNEVIITSLAGLDNAGPLGAVSGFVASLSVQDLKKAEDILVQVLTHEASKSDANGVASNVLKEIDHEGAKIRYLTPLRASSSTSLAFAFHNKRLVMAFDVPKIKRALKVLKDGGSLADSKDFKAGLAGVGGKMGPMFSYVDWGYTYKTVFNIATTALKLIAPTDILRQIGIDMNLLPSTETVAQHLFPGFSVSQITANGVVMTSRSPLPSIEVISPPIAAITAAFASFRPLVAPGKK